ncbi:hypothetical protein NMG60_11007126 [Bertholletia excelsa]
MEGKKMYLAAIIFYFITAGMFVLSKAALNDGMGRSVFIFYRQLAGTIVFVPVLIFKRERVNLLTFTAFCKTFLLSLFGMSAGFEIYAVALDYTTPTLAAAIGNCMQAMTFFLAVLLGYEKFKCRTVAGAAKLGGIMLCLAGVATLAFYQGPYFEPPFHLHRHHRLNTKSQHHSIPKHWVKGCFLMFTANFCWSIWFVCQAHVLKEFTSKLMFTSLQCLLSTVQTGVIAAVMDRDSSRWRMGWDIRLLSIVYSAFMISVIGTNIQTWVIQRKGPVFLAMWTPLSLIVTIFFSTFLLSEVISLGRIVGGILLVGSLYSVLWAKSKEEQMTELNNQGCLKAEDEQGQA